MDPQWKKAEIKIVPLEVINGITSGLETAITVYKTALEIYATIAEWIDAAINMLGILDAIVIAFRDAINNFIDKLLATGIYVLPVVPQIGGNDSFYRFVDQAFHGRIMRDASLVTNTIVSLQEVDVTPDLRTPMNSSDPNAPPFWYPTDWTGGVLFMFGGPFIDILDQFMSLAVLFDIKNPMVPQPPPTFRCRSMSERIYLTWPVIAMNAGWPDFIPRMNIYRGDSKGDFRIVGMFSRGSLFIDDTVTVGEEYTYSMTKLYVFVVKHLPDDELQGMLEAMDGKKAFVDGQLQAEILRVCKDRGYTEKMFKVVESTATRGKSVICSTLVPKPPSIMAVPDGWYKFTLGQLPLVGDLAKLKGFVDMIADVFLSNTEGAAKALQDLLKLLNRIIVIIGTLIRMIQQTLNALKNIPSGYMLPIPLGIGGNDHYLETIKIKLDDTEDSNTPTFNTDSFVGGLLVLAGGNAFGQVPNFQFLLDAMGAGDLQVPVEPTTEEKAAQRAQRFSELELDDPELVIPVVEEPQTKEVIQPSSPEEVCL